MKEKARDESHKKGENHSQFPDMLKIKRISYRQIMDRIQNNGLTMESLKHFIKLENLLKNPAIQNTPQNNIVPFARKAPTDLSLLNTFKEKHSVRVSV
jgi:hypothetical protein